ncbi:hypothetical protein APA_246 [Pseudanabaena sp. lw0831]|nr:hypothetical protein APA_246 [Pseudanabaena sp. lw0831]
MAALRAANTSLGLFDQNRHKKGRRAKPRNGFYILIRGKFESKLL